MKTPSFLFNDWETINSEISSLLAHIKEKDTCFRVRKNSLAILKLFEIFNLWGDTFKQNELNAIKDIFDIVSKNCPEINEEESMKEFEQKYSLYKKEK